MLDLHDWQSFYILTGTAAATLIGLLFVAISLGGYLPAERAHQYLRTFVNPTLVYYLQILLISCLAVIPSQRNIIYSVAFLILGGIDAALAFRIGWHVLIVRSENYDLDRDDWLWHIAVPMLNSVLLVGTAISLFFDQSIAKLLLAAALLLCLGTNIRNSWTLTVWLILHRGAVGEAQQTTEQKSR